MAKDFRTKKLRRRAKMVMRSGGKYQANHKAKTGRTGQIQSKRTASSKQTIGSRSYIFVYPCFVLIEEIAA
jgi:hypothetical protein